MSHAADGAVCDGVGCATGEVFVLKLVYWVLLQTGRDRQTRTVIRSLQYAAVAWNFVGIEMYRRMVLRRLPLAIHGFENLLGIDCC